MTVKYLIGSPGRSGSIFVALTIARSLKIPVIMSNQTVLPNTDNPFVYHSHDAQLQLDSDIPVLHIMRKDLFAEIISAVISEQYNEWSVYTGNKAPFVADIEVFDQKYRWHKYWHKAHQALTNYNNRQVLNFENFIGCSQVICDQLQIPQVQFQTNKSPYSQKNILNIDELRNRFAQLEADPELINFNPTEWKDLRAK